MDTGIRDLGAASVGTSHLVPVPENKRRTHHSVYNSVLAEENDLAWRADQPFALIVSGIEVELFNGASQRNVVGRSYVFVLQ